MGASSGGSPELTGKLDHGVYRPGYLYYNNLNQDLKTMHFGECVKLFELQT